MTVEKEDLEVQLNEVSIRIPFEAFLPKIREDES